MQLRRNLTTHGAKVLPVNAEWRRRIYDAITGFFWLPDYRTYASNHRKHHAYTAGPSDPDQRFIAFVGARMDGPGRFAATLFNPAFHGKFLVVRLKAVFLSGPVWRRAIAAIPLAMMVIHHGLALKWVLFVGVFYQAATLLQWLTEHLWGTRPTGLKAVDTARAVTFGRLFLPVPKPGGGGVLVLVIELIGWACVRSLFLSGDLPNHDLHHLGKGPWTEAPFVRTQLILGGDIELNQTGGFREMFHLAFETARTAPPLDLYAMDENQMLGL